MTAQAITLRPAAAADAEAMAGLLVQLYRTEVPGVLHGQVAGQVRLFQHIVAYELAGGVSGRYVAVDAAGQVLGSASLRTPSSPIEMTLPPGLLRVALTTVGLNDTLGLLLSALRASFSSEVSLRAGEGYIYSVVVDAAARGRGVGAAMMCQLEEIARHMGLSAALLRVLVGNETARRLYLRLGYSVVSRTPPLLDWMTFPTELMRKGL
jgi:ribosomal protein S18 acetylase RimI-like enzyme